MKTVTLGITTYGGATLLGTCLRSIYQSVFREGYSNFDVVIIDDGSPTRLDDVNWAWNSRWFSKIRLVREEENLGNVARYNTIVEQSKGDIIFLLDSDVLLPNRWFVSALHFLTANEKVGVASYLSEKVASTQVNELLDKPKIPAIGSGRVPERATELAAYCFGFRRESYALVGGFDSENFKYFIGDSDFCCRLAEKGLMSYRILYPMVYHREHATYDAYPELKAWSRVNEDLANFKKKWNASPKEMERKFLAEVKPQMISWYANYAVHYDWDVQVQGDLEFFKPPVSVMSYDEVPKEAKGKET